MKKKYVAIALGVVMSTSLLAGCGTNTTTASSTAELEGTVYGAVTQIDGESVTLELGTKKESSDSSDTNSADKDTSSESGSSENTDGNTPADTSEPPAKPDGDGSSSSDKSEPPAKPDGDGSSASSTDGSSSSDTSEPSAKPDGDGSTSSDTSEPPAKPDGEDGSAPSGGGAPGETQMDAEDLLDLSGEEVTIEIPDGMDVDTDDLEVGDVIAVTYDEDGNISEVEFYTGETGNMGQNMQSASGVESYDAVTEYTEDTEVDGETYTSTGTDENAIHVYNGANVSLSNITVNRTSEDSQGGDNSSFYGVGAAVLTTDGTTTIKNASITTDAAGAAGVFSYGDNSTVYVSDSEITTSQDTAGGIHVAGGGTLYAWDLTVNTAGQSSAAIRSDRGGGTMVVDGGSYTSTGTGSPAVYSTADISVNDAQLTAENSEAVCIEGLNSLRLFGCDLTGSMQDDEQNDCTWNVILYQSMSGDSEVGNSTFEMVGGTLTAENGGMFYTTNTESTFVLSGVDITYADENDFFLRCTGNQNQRGWGTTGENGADCLFTAIDQEMEGNIIWDSISQLDFYMTQGSTLTGAVVDDESYAGDGGNGYCNLYIDADSTWVVTGDSVLSSLQNAGTIVDADGNTVTIKGSDGTVYVNGTSEYTVTVDSYSTTVDTSGASAATSFSDYAVDQA